MTLSGLKRIGRRLRHAFRDDPEMSVVFESGADAPPTVYCDGKAIGYATAFETRNELIEGEPFENGAGRWRSFVAAPVTTMNVEIRRRA